MSQISKVRYGFNFHHGFKDLPVVQDIDVDLFMLAYANNSGSYVKEEKDFGDYINMIRTQHLSSVKLDQIGRNHLNNPLFYDIITSAITIYASPELRRGFTFKEKESTLKWLEIVFDQFLLPHQSKLSLKIS